MIDEPLFLRACRGDLLPRPPIWIMRQAGRYLPEYRAVRAKVDFLTLCRTPELACEVTLQPIRRFGFDASIVFSDIMMPLEAMGVELQFNPGPLVMAPIRSIAQVDALRVPDPQAIAPYVAATIVLLRRELKVPLIGFAGAPLTLAAYLIEGRGSKDFSKMRSFMHAEPQAMHRLLDKLADCMLHYLQAQIAAGAQVVQLFDSWAGVLSRADYRTYALGPVQKIMAGLKATGVPRIYFANDAAALWPAVREVDAEVYGVDWRSHISDVRQIVGPAPVLQGNLDPAVLFAAQATVGQAADTLLCNTRATRHIVNLGHGILPETPIASVERLIERVQAQSVAPLASLGG